MMEQHEFEFLLELLEKWKQSTTPTIYEPLVPVPDRFVFLFVYGLLYSQEGNTRG